MVQRLEEEGGGVIPSKAEEVRAHTAILGDWELLTLKQFLLKFNYGKDLVDYILNRDKDGDNNSSGVDIGDRDNAGISDSGDNKNDTSY